MKQKLQRFRKDIRRKQQEDYFKQKRQFLMRNQPQQNEIMIHTVSNKERQFYKMQIQDQSQESNLTEADIYQQWKLDQKNIEVYLQQKKYDRVLVILGDIYDVLRKVKNPKNMLNWKKNIINHVFLRTNILSNAVKCVIFAQKQGCSSGTVQGLSKTSVSILKYFVTEQPGEFTQEVYLQSDLLLFLRVCISEPQFDKSHLDRIIFITIQMMLASISETTSGQLFNKLNDVKSQFYNISAPFFNISKMQLKPEENVTINFIIMMKIYLQRIEQSQSLSKQNKNPLQLIPLNLSNNYLDICFEISINSVHFYLKSNFMQDMQQRYSLQQSLQVLKLLIQKSDIKNRWLDRIDYKGLINLLRFKNCPYQIAIRIFIIVDHLIASEKEDSKFAFEFVKDCEIIPIIWMLKDQYNGYVINILSNIALMSQFKSDLDRYVHNIILSLRFQSNCYNLFFFIYNWFRSQNFQLRESKDHLIVRMLAESKEQNKKITDLQSLIWLGLSQNNQISIPQRILKLDNESSNYIRQNFTFKNEEIIQI